MKLFSAIKSYLQRRFYIVGISQRSESGYNTITKASNNIKWLKFKNYKKDWIADPFILSADHHTIVLFAEEMESSKQKGRLVKLTINSTTYELLNKVIILELDTHLSFPIIYEENNHIYVYPENYQSGTVQIYEYNRTKEILENPKTIIDEPLLDTQIVRLSGIYYAFGIKYNIGNQQDTKFLQIYKSDTLCGKYTHIQTISNQLCEERGAGAIFESNGKIIRPAQCCEGDYGKSVIFYELIKEGDYFREIKLGKLLPNPSYPEGLHTYNHKNGISVIDGNAYVCGNILSYIKAIIR